MTLGEFFDWLSAHPAMVIGYFIALPLIAFIACVVGKEEFHLAPWKYVHSSLIYLSALPGIFAITLNIYFFFFDRQKVLDINLFTQVLPIISMIATLFIISKNVKLDSIPGFTKLSSLLLIMMVLISILWILDKTRIWAVTFVPFYYIIIFLVIAVLLIHFGLRNLVGANDKT